MDPDEPADRRPRPSRRLRLGLTVVKGTALGVLVSLVAVGGLQAASSESGRTGSASPDDAYQRVVERAGTGHRCPLEKATTSARGSSALIRTVGGEERVVSFQQGWDVYNGKRPGRLLAVCVTGDRAGGRHLVQVDPQLTS